MSNKERWERLYYKAAEYLPFTTTNLVWNMIDRSTKSLLDVGCGPGMMGGVIKRHHDIYTVGVDIFDPYLERCRREHTHDKLMRMDVKELPFEDGSFDTVLCKEVIEHLEQNEALKLIGRMEAIARRQVIITTPVGHYAQHEYDDNPHQEHLSIWTPQDMRRLGYEVRGVGVRNMHGEDGLYARTSTAGKRALDIIYIMAGPFVYFRPESACFMVCHKIKAGGETR